MQQMQSQLPDFRWREQVIVSYCHHASKQIPFWLTALLLLCLLTPYFICIFISQSTKQRTEAWGHLQGIITTASHRALPGPSDRAGLCFVPWKEAIASKSFPFLFFFVCVCLNKAGMNPIEHERSTDQVFTGGIIVFNRYLDTQTAKFKQKISSLL